MLAHELVQAAVPEQAVPVLVEVHAVRRPRRLAIEENAEGTALVLAEGEETGHCHAVRERVTLFRDDRLAEDIPAGLYFGHVQVASAYARVTHDEHAPITLPRGTWRVRRQRELGPRDARVLPD